ncbi:CcdB family protein [Comamonas granuli]|uniref:CcdB family protein n=1 Tax=Comamonas granuli TaxID=290309 RepID=UPI0005A942F0|nr:CcdB family protein [Comamonas granuli]
MARLDIYDNPIAEDRDAFPYVMEIQSDLLHRFVERVCVPLALPDAFPGMTERLNPPVAVRGRTVHVHPFGIAVFHACELRQPVGTAKTDALAIETALDMLLRGY